MRSQAHVVAGPNGKQKNYQENSHDFLHPTTGIIPHWGSRRGAKKSLQVLPPPSFLFASSLAQTAAGRELGDLFEYRIGHPVTIRKNESAMLPFLQQRINGRRLLMYSESYGSRHPLAAVEITNLSGKTLDLAR